MKTKKAKVKKLQKKTKIANKKKKKTEKIEEKKVEVKEKPLENQQATEKPQAIITKKPNFEETLESLKSGKAIVNESEIDKELALKKMTIENLKRELGIITQQTTQQQNIVQKTIEQTKENVEKPKEQKVFVEKVEKIETDFDRILKYLEQKGKVSFSMIAKDLNIEWKLVDECCNILKEEGKADIIYPPFGDPVCILVKKTN
ncbi:MAG: hypothetical protein QXU92_04095 [Candidatus Diapherotrites archaeon]